MVHSLALANLSQAAGFTPNAATRPHWERLLANLCGDEPLDRELLQAPFLRRPEPGLPTSLTCYSADLPGELAAVGDRLRRDGSSRFEIDLFQTLTALRWQRAHDARERLRRSGSWAGKLTHLSGAGERHAFVLEVRRSDLSHPVTQWVALGREHVQLHVAGSQRIGTDGRWWAFKHQPLGVQLELTVRDTGYYCSLRYRRGAQLREATGMLFGEHQTNAVVVASHAVIAAPSHEERF